MCLIRKYFLWIFQSSNMLKWQNCWRIQKCCQIPNFWMNLSELHRNGRQYGLFQHKVDTLEVGKWLNVVQWHCTDPLPNFISRLYRRSASQSFSWCQRPPSPFPCVVSLTFISLNEIAGYRDSSHYYVKIQIIIWNNCFVNVLLFHLSFDPWRLVCHTGFHVMVF